MRVKAKAARADSVVSELLSMPMLSYEENFALARRWRQDGDLGAFQELVRAYYKLAFAEAVRFRQYGSPLADLVQEATIGVIEAAAALRAR